MEHEERNEFNFSYIHLKMLEIYLWIRQIHCENGDRLEKEEEKKKTKEDLILRLLELLFGNSLTITVFFRFWHFTSSVFPEGFMYGAIHFSSAAEH